MAINDNFKIVSNIDDAGVISHGESITSELFPQIESTPRGVKILGTLPNLKYLLKKYGISVKYNRISKEIDTNLPSGALKGVDYIAADITSLATFNNYPVAHIDKYIGRISVDNEINPIKDWILSKEWDGNDRFKQVINNIHTPKKYDLAKKIYVKRWCYSAVSMLDNNCDRSYEGVLVFQGKQGIGKTKWIRRLCGEMSEYVKDALVLDPHNKDSVLTAVSHWIAEIGELDSTFKKSEIGALKGFLSSNKDTLRKPYGKGNQTYPRTTVFFATVNDMQFLKDETGDRRFWCLPVINLCLPQDFEAQQFWAQINQMLNDEPSSVGFDKWFLNEDEILIRDDLNANFREDNPIEQILLKYFEPSGKEEYYMSATEVANILGLGIDRATVSSLGKCISKHFGRPERKAVGMIYRMPIPANRTGYNITTDKLKRIED